MIKLFVLTVQTYRVDAPYMHVRPWSSGPPSGNWFHQPGGGAARYDHGSNDLEYCYNESFFYIFVSLVDGK